MGESLACSFPWRLCYHSGVVLGVQGEFSLYRCEEIFWHPRQYFVLWCARDLVACIEVDNSIAGIHHRRGNESGLAWRSSVGDGYFFIKLNNSLRRGLYGEQPYKSLAPPSPHR